MEQMTIDEKTTLPMTEGELWEALKEHEGETFCTSGRGSRPGVAFTYQMKGGELFVSRKEKSITKASVMKAYQKVLELDGIVTGPKKLGTFGASYLYPVFLALGLCRKEP